MKKTLILILALNLVIACRQEPTIVDTEIISEQLKVSYTGDADTVVFKMFEGIHQVLTRDTLNGHFEAIIDIPNLKEALFTYDIVVHKKDASGRMLELEPNSEEIRLNDKQVIKKDDDFLWIGEHSKRDFPENEVLVGSVETRLFQTKFLDEDRALSIYKPAHTPVDIPIIYFTDGSAVKNYAHYVDYLIENHEIEPVILVGIHCSRSNRYEEYVKTTKDNKLFDKHEQFVFNEVMPEIEKEIEHWQGERYMYGCSNGAAFCMYSGLNYPEYFKEIIAFSVADYISPIAQMLNPIEFKFKEYPSFYMGAGRYETSIYRSNLKFIDQVKREDLQVEFKDFIAGHDYNVWRIEFLDYVKKRFKKN